MHGFWEAAEDPCISMVDGRGRFAWEFCCPQPSDCRSIADHHSGPSLGVCFAHQCFHRPDRQPTPRWSWLDASHVLDNSGLGWVKGFRAEGKEGGKEVATWDWRIFVVVQIGIFTELSDVTFCSTQIRDQFPSLVVKWWSRMMMTIMTDLTTTTSRLKYWWHQQELEEKTYDDDDDELGTTERDNFREIHQIHLNYSMI